MWTGRSVDQKRRLLRAITDAMVEHAGANPEHLHVTVQEYELDNWARAGVLAADTAAAKPAASASASSAESAAASTGAAEPAGGEQPATGSLHHLLIECQDLDASVRFYTDVVGIGIRAKDTHRDGRPLVLTHHSIAFTTASGTGRNIDHLAFPVASVSAVVQRAESAGARIVRGPGPGPYGHTVYVADPDGTEVELFEADD